MTFSYAVLGALPLLLPGFAGSTKICKSYAVQMC
jgi:hypothetical protein